ncbi:MAG: CvpA family protein [Candidatus Riflebacteria bacterium]|nr:CvpA family protein [Candidatus Riflebacteria bacterium]
MSNQTVPENEIKQNAAQTAASIVRIIDTPPPETEGFFKFLLKPLIITAYLLAIITMTVDMFSSKNITFSSWSDLFTLLTILLFAILGYLNGIIREVFFLTRILGSVAIALIFRAQAGSLIHLEGMAGQIAGFYLIFFPLYTIAGFIIPSMKIYRKPPLAFHKISGGLLGILEGIVISIIFLVIISIMPSNKSIGGNDNSTAMKISNFMIPSKIPGLDVDPMPIIKIAMDCKNGIDFQKIDTQKLKNEFSPLLNNNTISDLRNDQEIQMLIKDGKIANLLAHPKVRKLTTDKEFTESLSRINWSSVAEEIAKGKRSEDSDTKQQIK